MKRKERARGRTEDSQSLYWASLYLNMVENEEQEFGLRLRSGITRSYTTGFSVYQYQGKNAT